MANVPGEAVKIHVSVDLFYLCRQTTYLNALRVCLDNAGLTDAAENRNNCLKNNKQSQQTFVAV